MKKTIKQLQKSNPNFYVFVMALGALAVSGVALYLSIIALKIIGNT